MEIIGHKKQWEYLKSIVDSKRMAHAYLFSGPSQIGKKKIALEFAKYINCAEAKKEPCNKCQSCYQTDQLSHSDLIFIEPEIDKKSISIEQIRDLKDKVSLSPLNKGYKIAIIDQAHLMTFEAQSALLKQLEEPKGKKVIILITEYPQNLLTTIVSRCQAVRFWLVSEEEIKKRFKDSGMCAFGKPGMVIESLEGKENGLIWEKRIAEIEEVKKKDLYHRFEYANQLSKEAEINQTFEIWLSYFRQLMQNQILDKDIKRLWELSETRKIINSIQDYQYLLSSTPLNTRLTLELFLLEI